MTKEEILKMEPGEEMDKLVATEVMGEPMPEFVPEDALELQLAGSPVKSPQGNWLCLCKYDEGDIPTWRPVPYSADISVAWLVVVKLHKEGYIPTITWLDGRGWFCNFWKSGAAGGGFAGFSAPETICKASLIASLL